MYKLDSMKFLKFHGIQRGIKVSPFILVLAMGTPLFSETLSSDRRYDRGSFSYCVIKVT